MTMKRIILAVGLLVVGVAALVVQGRPVKAQLGSGLGLGAVCDKTTCFCIPGAPKPYDCRDMVAKCVRRGRKKVQCEPFAGTKICVCMPDTDGDLFTPIGGGFRGFQ